MVLSLSPVLWAGIALLTAGTHATCYDPSPAFPPPSLDSTDPILLSAFKSLEQTLGKLANDEGFNATSFSVEVTSTESTLWSYHHTASVLNSSRPGASPVTDESFYRIASITKTFTTLALLMQAEAGNLTLDDPVNKYLPELKGAIPWKDITLRTLASQLSGIPRDWSQGDLLAELKDPSYFGLPPPNNTALPECYGYNEQYHPCQPDDLYYSMSQSKPLFAPNQRSTYSNTNFEILGLVLANVTNQTYEQVIKSLILSPLNMTSGGTFTIPSDSDSVLPDGTQYYHDVDEGVHNPTGGLFMSTSAMSIFLRHVLSIFNSPPTISLQTGNWFAPHSFTSNIGGFYGMPWEIFRTSSILTSSTRPITFYTKGGGLPGYSTLILLVPESNLAMSIFVGGNADMLSKLREVVTVTLINAVEDIAANQAAQHYTGRYSSQDPHLNSSVILAYSKSRGLTIESLISNSTDVPDVFRHAYPGILPPESSIQLTPTLLYVDEQRQKGEIWRFVFVPERPDKEEAGVWDDECVTNIDLVMYDGLPLNEVVYWREEGEVEFTAFRVRMKKDGHGDGEGIFVQEL